MMKILVQVLFCFVGFAAFQLATGDGFLSSLMSGFIFAAFMAFCFFMIAQTRGR